MPYCLKLNLNMIAGILRHRLATFSPAFFFFFFLKKKKKLLDPRVVSAHPQTWHSGLPSIYHTPWRIVYQRFDVPSFCHNLIFNHTRQHTNNNVVKPWLFNIYLHTLTPSIRQSQAALSRQSAMIGRDYHIIAAAIFTNRFSAVLLLCMYYRDA